MNDRSAPRKLSFADLNLQSVATSSGAAVVIAILASLVILGPLLMLAGVSVGEGYSVLFGASIGSSYGFTSLLLSSTPLLVTGIGVTLAYRSGMVNVGGDGQILVGAVAAVLLFPAVSGMPGVLAVAMMMILGGLAGGAWGLIAGVLKKWRSVNEIISTIMLNILAALLVQYLVAGPLKGDGLQYAATDNAPLSSWLGNVAFGSLRVPVGFIVALLILSAVSAVTHYTGWGWRQRVTGLSAPLALRQRVNVPTMYMNSLLLSGAFAGIAGVLELLGNQHRVGQEFTPGWGFYALAVALLARGRFPAVLPLVLYIGALLNGSGSLQSELALSGNFVQLLVGLPVVATAALIGYVDYAPRRRSDRKFRTKAA